VFEREMPIVALLISSVCCPLIAQSVSVFDLYGYARNIKSTESGKTNADHNDAEHWLRKYLRCGTEEDCTESLKQFVSAICARRSRSDRNLLGSLIYEAARASSRARALQALALIKALYPEVNSMRFVYRATGVEGNLAQVLSDGMRLPRDDARPWDEQYGIENFPYNIAPWDAESVEHLNKMSFSLSQTVKNTCQPQ
jgi:hypothetical protein